MSVRSLLLTIGFLFVVTQSEGDITVEVSEFSNPSMVIMSASGTLDTEGISKMTSAYSGGGVSPGEKALRFSPPGGSTANISFIATGMIAFGSVGIVGCDYFEGDNLGFEEGRLSFPTTYTSGDPLSSSIVFLDESLASLGFDAAGDRITIKVVKLVDNQRLLSSLRKTRVLKRKNKSLKRKLRAAKRRSR